MRVCSPPASDSLAVVMLTFLEGDGPKYTLKQSPHNTFYMGSHS